MPPVMKDAKASGGVTRKDSFMRVLANVHLGLAKERVSGMLGRQSRVIGCFRT